MCAAGEVVWVGAGALGSSDGRIRLFFADQLSLLAPAIEAQEQPAGDVHVALRSALQQRGALFFSQLRAAAPQATDADARELREPRTDLRAARRVEVLQIFGGKPGHDASLTRMAVPERRTATMPSAAS